VSVAEVGVQTPRIMRVPKYQSSAGAEAVELAAMAGLLLDPWEALVLKHALGERLDGRWAATEVGLCVPRQNGKNAVLEARELVGLFLLGEPLIIHSAQHFKTAKEHFLRLLGLIEATPDFARRVKKVIRTHGEEGIELTNGQRILFFARTKSSGRGFTAPLVVYDEAMFLAEASLGALMPTMATMPNRQRWFTGSAVDQLVHLEGVVFARVRERALAASDPRLAYFEWSLEHDTPDLLDGETARDPGAWAVANPGLGIRIMAEAVEDEFNTLDRRTFAVERLGVGDWPPTDLTTPALVAPEVWFALTDEASQLLDPVCFAFDVAPDRSSAAIAAAGRRHDGLLHLEIVAHDRGATWAPQRLAQLNDRWHPLAVLCDAVGPVASLVHACEEAGVIVQPVKASEHAKACGMLLDTIEDEGLRHLGSAELAVALAAATKRPLGDAFAWSRKNSNADITPLVAATLALWGAITLGWNPDEELRIY
jgi:hypothetical protein